MPPYDLMWALTPLRCVLIVVQTTTISMVTLDIHVPSRLASLFAIKLCELLGRASRNPTVYVPKTQQFPLPLLYCRCFLMQHQFQIW
jgi:hypothetical protein